MAADNYFIAEQFDLLSKLMDIHGENSFKSKTYSVAAFNIEKLPQPLADTPRDKIFSIKGIGDSVGKKVIEILDNGQMSALKDYMQKTPPGVLEMLYIKGLGPKKIATVWKQMEIESLGELLYACNENRLLLFKGFGEKTQRNVQEAIEFYFRNQGHHLYAEAESYALKVDSIIREKFPDQKTTLTGQFRRQLEVIGCLEWVTVILSPQLTEFLLTHDFKPQEQTATMVSFKGAANILLKFYLTDHASFYSTLFAISSSEAFANAFMQLQGWDSNAAYSSEEAIFEAVHLPVIPPARREKATILQKPHLLHTPTLIMPQDIKAIIHCHSNWSDGLNTIEEMARACIEKGYEYLVISDHSKSAFYANGLTEERIREQHRYIDELNAKLAPFRIFKSIECDILNDGSLDYSDNVLASFDLVIASIHSNLKMPEEKAMMRLLNAISNPYTTILGHMTGRLLLSRQGYPVNHEQIIEACVKHNVVIELNAHPRRLDMDWRFIDDAVEKGALISIDPDAHSVEGYEACRYGVLAAQKAGLTREKNLSSFTLKEFEAFLEK